MNRAVSARAKRLLIAAALKPGIQSIAGYVLPPWALATLRRRFVELGHAGGLDRDVFDRVLSVDALRQPPVPGRIVLVSGSLGPGGAERQVVNTLGGLVRAGYTDVHLLSGDLGGGPRMCDFYLEQARASGAAIRRIRRSRGPVHACLEELPPKLAVDVMSLYLELRQLRPSVVHSYLDYTNVRAGLAAVLAGVPRVLLSGRSMAPDCFDGYHEYFRPAYRALRSAAGVQFCTNSHAGADHYAAWLEESADRINVVHNGLDAADLRRRPVAPDEWRRLLSIPPGVRVMGGMARFTVEKRPELWLETAARVAAKRRDVWFVLYGDGVLRPRLQALARRLKLDDRLRLPGITTNPFSAMRAMDVFVLTSQSEGLPNVLLEAQMCGLPVVTTRAGGSIEAIDDGTTGWLLESGDPAAIADRVLDVLGDRAFSARAREAGPRFVAAHFGLERMIARTLDLYGLPPVRESGSAEQLFDRPAVDTGRWRHAY